MQPFLTGCLSSHCALRSLPPSPLQTTPYQEAHVVQLGLLMGHRVCDLISGREEDFLFVIYEQT